MAVALVGLSGDKEKGLQYLTEDFPFQWRNQRGCRSRAHVFLRREHRYAEAYEIAGVIGSRFPRSYLLPLEQANLLRPPARTKKPNSSIAACGRTGATESTAICTTKSPRWRWATCCAARRNMSRRGRLRTGNPGLRRRPGIPAESDLGAGEMYDQLRKRDLALKKYEAVVAINSGNAEADKARNRMKEAYRE